MRTAIVRCALDRLTLEEGPRMSYTLVAVDGTAGLLGVASASKSLAVGNSVPSLDPALGVVASQAWTNRLLRHLVLEELHGGSSPDEALARLPEWDERHDLRQVAVVDVQGRLAVFTGESTSAWAGHRVGTGHVALGNLLAGPEVVDAMHETFVASEGPPGAVTVADIGRRVVGGSDAGPAVAEDGALAPFAHRILASLAAGEAAGGDLRGRQSAALVVGRIQPIRIQPPELAVDLRVDDAAEPIAELERLLLLRTAELSESRDPEKVPQTAVG